MPIDAGSSTCASAALLLQVIEAFLQNCLVVGHLLLHALLLACQTAHIINVRRVKKKTNGTPSKWCVQVPWPQKCRVDIPHSLVGNVHRLGVSWGDHEAHGRGVELVSGRILHVPPGPIVAQERVPLPAQDRPLSMFERVFHVICYRKLDQRSAGQNMQSYLAFFRVEPENF